MIVEKTRVESLIANLQKDMLIIRDAILEAPKELKEQQLQQFLSIASMVLEEAKNAAMQDQLGLEFMNLTLRHRNKDDYDEPSLQSKWFLTGGWASSDHCSFDNPMDWENPNELNPRARWEVENRMSNLMRDEDDYEP